MMRAEVVQPGEGVKGNVALGGGASPVLLVECGQSWLAVTLEEPWAEAIHEHSEDSFAGVLMIGELRTLLLWLGGAK